jgi:hypothetical protein
MENIFVELSGRSVTPNNQERFIDGRVAPITNGNSGAVSPKMIHFQGTTTAGIIASRPKLLHYRRTHYGKNANRFSTQDRLPRPRSGGKPNSQ